MPVRRLAFLQRLGQVVFHEHAARIDSAVNLKILTLNVHKGFSSPGREFVLPEIREAIRGVSADVVFLQEVYGAHDRHERRVEKWPVDPQFEYLADEVWSHHAYAKNAIYRAGHHGSAILSKFPIVETKRRDVSASRFEQRGILYTDIEIPGTGHHVHCFCIHLGLFSRWRHRQIEDLEALILDVSADGEPTIVAGDFNDWTLSVDREIQSLLGLTEVYAAVHGRPVRSYPAWCPWFRLDRIYVKRIRVVSANRHADEPWRALSDHAALSADVWLEP